MNFFLPIKYKLISQLSEEHILHILKKNVDQETSPFLVIHGGNTKRFKGKIKGNSFRIYRYIDSSNSFRPIIKGETSMDNQFDTVINLKMGISIFIKIFTIIWFSVFTSASLISLLLAFNSGNLFSPLFLPILIPVSMFLISNYFFKKEVKLSKEILIEIFEAKEVKEK